MYVIRAAAHVCLLGATATTSGSRAEAFIHGKHSGSFHSRPPPLAARSALASRHHVASGTRGGMKSEFRRTPLPARSARAGCSNKSSSCARLRALPEDTDVENSSTTTTSSTSSKQQSAVTSTSDAAAETSEGSAPASPGTGYDSSSGAGAGGRRRSGASGGGSGTSKGVDGKFVSKLVRRLADSFPLLTADEIKKEVRALLNPEAKGESSSSKVASSREDNLTLLARDVRELVEELTDQMGSNTESNAGLAELKELAQRFQGVLRGDPEAAEKLRRRVLEDLEEVREEIEELLEVKELAKARERLEKATQESTEVVFDSAVTALAKGLDKVVNEGKDTIAEGEDVEKFQVSTYFYGKDNEFWDDMRAHGVTRQRFFLYTFLGGAVGLGGNLFGVTSGILSNVAPEASRGLRVDLLFPIGGFKRFYSPEDGYEFMYPQNWVGDSGLALRRQRDLEDMRASPAAVARARQRRSSSAPEVAFGPQGGDGIENISVVKSELMPGFSLRETLGEPREAAERLLSTVIAPPDSGREWELLDAFEETREPGGLVYQFEYRVQGQRIRKPMRNMGVVAARGSTLFTVTVLAPEESWGVGGRGEKFREMAKSFRLTF